MKPDRVILWLTEEEFPQKEAELPQELLELKKFGLTIGWAKENLRAHTKYYYTMTQYPDDIVITVDDDIYYDENLVENLYKCHQKFPKAISALRVHNITFDEDGNIKKYGSWIQSYTVAVEKPAMSLIATGVGGVLYPPHLLPEETFDVEKIRGLSFSADDIWLKFMEVMNGVPVVMAEGRHNLSFVGNTQLTGLYLDNAHDTGNDDCIRNVLAYYSDFRRNGKSISELIYADSIKAGSETKGFVRFAEKTERLRWASASKVKRGFMDINGQINKLNLSIYQLKEEQKLMNDKLDRIIELLERNSKS